jgi:D-alanyl-D-alanine-carboxypeptidase/D-alanyl-D-alanine-endopeptidase
MLDRESPRIYCRIREAEHLATDGLDPTPRSSSSEFAMSMSSRLVLTLFALVACLPAPAAAKQFPADAEVKSMLEDRIASGRGVGIVVGLLDADGGTRVVFAGSAGEGAQPLGPRTVFEIGSITKVFTGTLLADMVERGEVSLSDPVAKYLPPEVRVPSRGAREITLLDLATHRSGLPRLPANMPRADPANPYADYTVQHLYAFLRDLELEREIGSTFEYSNLGVGLLGHALARGAGSSYEAVIRQRILDPLRMDKTGIELKGEILTWMAHGHNARNAPVPLWTASALAAAGALRSDVLDMLRFLDANVGEPESELEQAMRTAHRPRPGTAPVAESDGPLIGLNWIIQPSGSTSILWHNGGTGGFRSFIGFDPDREVGVVVLSNSGHTVDDIGIHLLDPAFPLTQSNGRPSTAIMAGVAACFVLLLFAMWKTSRD